MRIKLQMPMEVENSREPATVLAIYRSLGDKVEVGQPLVEMINPDRIFDISSPVTGQVLEVAVREGQLVHGGETLLIIDSTNGRKGPRSTNG